MLVPSSEIGWPDFLSRNPLLCRQRLPLTLQAASLSFVPQWARCPECPPASVQPLPQPCSSAGPQPCIGGIGVVAAGTGSLSQFCGSHAGSKGSAVIGRRVSISHLPRILEEGGLLRAPTSEALSFVPSAFHCHAASQASGPGGSFGEGGLPSGPGVYLIGHTLSLASHRCRGLGSKGFTC